VLVVAAALCALAAPVSASALVVGMGDQKPDMFGDARFAALGLSRARLAVGWDFLTSPDQAARADAWLQAARAARVEPLVTFGHSLLGGRRRALPTPERFRYEFRRFRALYPWVTTFATWNEANHCGEPTCHRPRLVAAYYDALRSECPTCTVLAAEVLDMPNMVSWVQAFQAHARDVPRYWGLHNYLDANRLRTVGTRRLLGATTGQVWFTETGGIVSRTSRRRVTFPESVPHAARAVAWVFERLVALSRRVTRVYLYHWDADSPTDTWDSALIDPEGRERPAFAVLQRELFLRALASAGQEQRPPVR
jgi:hypothetical protein